MSHVIPAASERGELTPARSGWLVLTVLAIAQAMLVLDLTVVNVALPRLSVDLGLGSGLAGWAIAAYAVPFGGFLLLGGRLVDAAGAKRMLLIGLLVFVSGSLAAGLSSDAPNYLMSRAVQGVGAALLSPAALATLLRSFDGPARRRALAVWGAVGGAGAIVGVVVGGLLAGGPGWRWAFYLNVPIGIAVAILAGLILQSVPAGPRRRIDAGGALLATAGIACLVGAASVFAAAGGLVSLGLVVAGLLLLTAFVIVERRAAAPLVRLGLLTERAMAVGSLLMLMSTGLLVSVLLLLSFFLQDVLGWSPTVTGLAFLPIAGAIVVGAQSAGHLLGSAPTRYVGAIGIALTAIGLGVSAWGVSALQPAIAIVGAATGALGLGVGLVTSQATALAAVERDESGTASAVVSSAHEIGSATGAATAAALAATVSTSLALGWSAAIASVVAILALFLLPRGRLDPGARPMGH